MCHTVAVNTVSSPWGPCHCQPPCQRPLLKLRQPTLLAPGTAGTAGTTGTAEVAACCCCRRQRERCCQDQVAAGWWREVTQASAGCPASWWACLRRHKQLGWGGQTEAMSSSAPRYWGALAPALRLSLGRWVLLPRVAAVGVAAAALAAQLPAAGKGCTQVLSASA